jgi:hypothetical protein
MTQACAGSSACDPTPGCAPPSPESGSCAHTCVLVPSTASLRMCVRRQLLPLTGMCVRVPSRECAHVRQNACRANVYPHNVLRVCISKILAFKQPKHAAWYMHVSASDYTCEVCIDVPMHVYSYLRAYVSKYVDKLFGVRVSVSMHLSIAYLCAHKSSYWQQGRKVSNTRRYSCTNARTYARMHAPCTCFCSQHDQGDTVFWFPPSRTMWAGAPATPWPS